MDPEEMLKQIAAGSFGKVIERNNKLIFIESTEKIKNSVLREFVEEALKDGYTYEDIVNVLLQTDAAVENNTIRQTLKDFMK